MSLVYQVCIPHTKRDFFEYLADGESPLIGARVCVPFRSKRRIGLVIAVINSETSSFKLKSIESIIDHHPLVTEDIMALCQWISQYYQTSLSEVLPLAIPKKYRLGFPAQLPLSEAYRLAITITDAHLKLSARCRRQHQLLDYIAAQSGLAISKKEILNAGFTLSQLNALVNVGCLIKENQPFKPDIPTSGDRPLELNSQQAQAVAKICNYLNSYQCFLLQGITGSGKTEVYLQVIASVLANQKQVLVLVPEIGLTPQLLSRFSRRFKQPIAVIHSHLNEQDRQIAWQLAGEGIARIVIGTRAAVFTPMPSLGLIVIDEEHDPSLKQMDHVRYSARDTALMRAYTRNIPIILGSATPSLETLYNCAIGKFILLSLTMKALESPALHYQLVDIRNQSLQHGLSSLALQTIKQHLAEKNQVLIFINRRGFSPLLLCHQCGWIADCRACDSHLTLHRAAQQLICHHCGASQRMPRYCRNCKNKELLPVGTGTQRVHEFLEHYFPDVHVLRIDRDEVRKKNALAERLEQINTGEAQLIVGTQMLAKGHHFPRLTLVVVLDSDNGFHNQDFRALERLGQLLIQVAGRAGRAELPGQVIIQTHLPQHPLLNMLIRHGYNAFAEELLVMRQQAELPPYSYLALLRAQDKNLQKVLDFMQATKDELADLGVTLLGPAPAPLAKKASQYRMQLLIKSASRKKLAITLTHFRQWLTIKDKFHVRWNIDVDPMDLS
ncbi:MAG: primosomal protein N' [Legionella sp.]